jgi:hypothetical protein
MEGDAIERGEVREILIEATDDTCGRDGEVTGSDEVINAYHQIRKERYYLEILNCTVVF